MKVNIVEEDPRSELLKIPKLFLLVSGCWRFKFTKLPLLQWFYNKLYSIICPLICVVLLLCMAIKIPDLFNRDLRRFMETIGFIFILSLIATKLVICRGSTVGDLIYRIIYEEKVMYRTNNLLIIENYNNHLKRTRKVHLMLILAIYSVCAWFYLSYLGVYIINFTPTTIITKGNVTEEVATERLAPLEMWMPFDQHLHYGTSYCILVVFIFTQTTFNSVSQILFISLMVYVIAELQNLQIIARNFDVGISGVDVEAECLENLKQLVIRHHKIVKFVDDLNNAVRSVMLQEYLLNSLSLANLMYQIPKSLETSILFTIFYLDFLIILVIELFFLAWHANEIQLQSLNLSDALYESNWYRHSKRVGRSILIVMIRSQKPLVIWIGPFLPMSLGVALTSVKAAYSYVTMMSRFSDN